VPLLERIEALGEVAPVPRDQPQVWVETVGAGLDSQAAITVRSGGVLTVMGVSDFD